MIVSPIAAAADQILAERSEYCQFKITGDETYQCPEVVHQENLCLFHTPKLSDSEKRSLNQDDRAKVKAEEREFTTRLSALIAAAEQGDEQIIDLRGYQFPRMNFPSISKSIDFTGAVFVQPINFDHTLFEGDAVFVFAQFPSDTSFKSASFRKRADFEGATFGEAGQARATFLKAIFDGGVNFNRAVFACEAQFSNSKFGHAESSFWDTSFMSHVAFGDSIFGGPTIFRSKFHGTTTFRGAQFGGPARFAESTFDQAADFRTCRFGSSDFSFVCFRGAALFQDADFSDAANFEHSRFEETANYSGGAFEKTVDFSESKFFGAFIGYDREYKGPTSFLLAEFAVEADLRNCTFDDKVDFMAASFTGDGRFSNSRFYGPVNFNHATFNSQGEFINHKTDYGFNDEVDFRDLNIGPQAGLTFRNVKLEKGRFTNSYLGAATFSNVKWLSQRHKLAPWTTRPAALWDEFRSSRNLTFDNYEAIAENYRQLVLNYEGKRDYETAESFHIGEMEMRRKKKAAGIAWFPLRKIREWLNSYGIYRASNHYGTSYGQALITLLGLIILFSLGFLYAGFRTVDDPKQTIEYNISSDALHKNVGAKQWANDLVAASALCMSILTFQKDRFYEPLEGLARLWLFLAVVALTGQAAMTLLALRRRFKR